MALCRLNKVWINSYKTNISLKKTWCTELHFCLPCHREIQKFFIWLYKPHPLCEFNKWEGACLTLLISELGSRISELLVCCDQMGTGGNLHFLWCFEWSHTMKKMPILSPLECSIRHRLLTILSTSCWFSCLLIRLFACSLIFVTGSICFTLFQTHGAFKGLRMKFQSRH